MTAFPQALRLDGGTRTLEVEWADGTSATLPFQLLRERCRCAECGSARRKGLPVKAGETVTVTEALPCGGGAVQLVFSDGHSRGIFPFAYLRELATLLQPT